MIILEPRRMITAVSVASVVLALLFGALFLSLTGRSALEVYAGMFGGAMGSAYGQSETVVKAIPLT